tara:strand:+ start:20 stop:199 length:180 start_codon:yes stop_codon:yes gene_type:complete
MDDFRLNCTTEIKTHDKVLALKLIKQYHLGHKSGLGMIVSYDFTPGYSFSLWIFRFVGE